MKTWLTVFFYLLITVHLYPQIKYEQQLNPEYNIKSHSEIRSDECIAPFNLDTQNYPIENDQYMVYLTYEIPSPENGWLSWDDGENFSAVGVCPDCLVYVAARWDIGYLINYEGYRISKVKAYLNDTKYTDLTFLIWNNSNISNPIYSHPIDTVIGSTWVEHTLDSLLTINSDLEYWVGYKLWVSEPNSFPFGTDNGEAITGYGDKISTDYVTWDNLSDFGLNYNWNIQFYVEDTAGREMKIGKRSVDSFYLLTGFNIYESINGGDFEFLEHFEYDPDTNYHGIVVDESPNERCYKLTAVWTNPVDTCESEPALAKDNPEQNYVCVLLVNNKNDISDNTDWRKCKPNPFTTSTFFEYSLSSPSKVVLFIFNSYGKLVHQFQEQQQEGKQVIRWDAGELPAGMYFYQLDFEEQVTTGKLLLMR